MARFPGADSVYEIAGVFRQRCLVEGRSFLWPDQDIWTTSNLQRLWNTLILSGDLDSLTSISSVASQEPVEVQMIATDVLAATCFFPAIRRSTQEKNFRDLLSHLKVPEMDAETWAGLTTIFNIELPGSFSHYKGGKSQNYVSALFGLMELVVHDGINAGRDALIEQIEADSKQYDIVWNSLIWGMFHAFFPDEIPAVPGEKDRRQLLNFYSSQLGNQDFPNDFAALDYLRRTLPQPHDNAPFDFYEPGLLRRWNPRHKRTRGLAQNEALSRDQESNPIKPAETADPERIERPLSELLETTHLEGHRIEEIHDLLFDKRQLIFEGPPGSGKTYVAEKFARWFTGQSLESKTPLNEQVEIVQFHQSYGYEDFVQGIRPETNDDGQLVYKVRDGIFLKMCELAASNPEKPFVLIIDEINRGNISRIFGELLLLLEYRDMTARLPYGSGDQATLTIPKNLYIIGTMNTADRSLAQIDYALRRRFYFLRFMPVENDRAPVFERWLGTTDIDQGDQVRLLDFFISLNNRISTTLNTDDLQVGHSYFMHPDIATSAGFNRAWNRAVQPLLEEYLHHHRDRQAILGDLHPDNLMRWSPVEEEAEPSAMPGVETNPEQQ